MKRKRLWMLGIFGLTSLVLGGQRKRTLRDQEALKRIEELHRKDIEASKARDFKTLLSLWTDDGVLLEPGKAPVIGREAIKTYMESQAETTKTYTIKKYVHDGQEIKVIGDWAFEWGFFSAEAQRLSEGKIVKQEGKIMRVLKRQDDGSWKCARAIYHNDPAED
jgi:uncharacterized protein (TIGR02246 family)